MSIISRAFIRKYFREPTSPGPLSGKTFAVKDNISVAGTPLSCGLNPSLIESAKDDAALVTKFLSLGAKLIGATNMDELCITARGLNRHYGNMVNPAYPEISPLGSSGGSAIAVSTGEVDFAIGTDIGGSVRAPAAAAKIPAIKLSRSVLPENGAVLLSNTLDSIGIFAKDLKVLKDILVAISTPTYNLNFNRQIFIPSNSSLNSLNASERAKFDGAIRLIQSKDFELSSLKCDFSQVKKTWQTLVAKDIALNINDLKIPNSSLPKEGLAILELAKKLSTDEIFRAERMQREISGTFSGITLLPVFPHELLTLNDIKSGRDIDNSFLVLANLCASPAVVLQYNFGDNTKPYSLQLIGPKGSDLTLVIIAEEITKQTRNT